MMNRNGAKVSRKVLWRNGDQAHLVCLGEKCGGFFPVIKQTPLQDYVLIQTLKGETIKRENVPSCWTKFLAKFSISDIWYQAPGLPAQSDDREAFKIPKDTTYRSIEGKAFAELIDNCKDYQGLTVFWPCKTQIGRTWSRTCQSQHFRFEG